MAWVQENLNPKGKHVGDCVIRAIAKAAGVSWDDAYSVLALQGYAEKDLLSANTVWGKYLHQLGFRRHTVPDTCPDCYTVERFCTDHPAGTYVLALQSHVVTVISGRYFDTWDSGQEPLLYYWERTD